MAEVSSLSSAHCHARRAVEELHQAHLKQAAEEHRKAATDFARVAKSTSDNEALRVLRLLEDQHQRLARIVRSREIAEIQPNADDAKATESRPASETAPTTTSPPGKAKPTTAKSTASAVASPRGDKYARDSSPSLARDIASRRGIPQSGRSQPSAAAQARSRQLSPESRRKVTSAPEVPLSVVDSQAALQQARRAKKAEDDEGFAKFYSNLTTGTMSKLSSVLAYAGLPLTAEDAVNHDQSSKARAEKRTVSASNDPDVKKIFHKAALDAIEEEHRQRGTLGHGFGPTESFYVVQKGGGTYSYADIAKARLQQLGEEDEEPEFVDAKEVPGPPSPKHARSSRQKRGSFGMPRTEEELELENTTLKTTLEQLAGRLAAFEAHAQDASMAALTQSMITLKPTATAGGGGTIDSGMQEQIRQLELEVEAKTEDAQKARTLAEKQARELKKFRYRFDELKEGARKKEKLKQEKLESPAVGAAGDGVTGD